MRFLNENATRKRRDATLGAATSPVIDARTGPGGERTTPAVADGPTRRSRAAGGRPHSVRVSLSDVEAAAVVAAAGRAGQAPGAWLGEAGVAAATQGRGPASSWAGVMQDLMGLRAEVMELRRVLRNVGGNLNDVAAQANATDVVHAAAARVLGLVGRTVERVDRAVAALDARLAAAREERLRGPS